MRKKTKYKSRLRDFLVIFLCLSVTGFFLFMFWKDLNSSSSRTDKEKIATISFKNKIAQRKFSDRVVWERVAQNSPLYDGDIIRTADLSQAIIYFNDGTTLDLSENTMIQIYYTENGLEISVDGGDIQVDSSAESNVALKLDDGSVVTVDAGASLAAKSDSSGAKSVEVKSGTAQVTTETGATASLALGESVSVEKGGEIQKRPLTVTSIPKEMRLLNIKGEPIPVTLAWKVNDEADRVTVQTSRAKDFSRIESERAFTTATSTDLSLEDGVMYWRVFAQNAPDMAVDGKITVEKIAHVQNVSPAAASEFRYRAANPRVNFRWTGNDYADRYRLLIATTPDMRGSPLTVETTDTFALVDTLTEGDYYWQVTPYYALNNIGYAGGSDVRSFSVVKNDMIRPPELSAPAENAQISYRNAVSATFMWKSELKNADYTLLLSRDADFANTVYTAQVSDVRFAHEFAPGELRDGTYYWKVVRKSGDPEDVSPESAVRSFTLAKYVPQENKLLYPQDGFSAEQQTLVGTQFMWKLGDDYKGDDVRSVVQISRQQDFGSVQVERVLDTTTLENLMLAEGAYYWRVGARLSDGTIEGLTAARQFTVLRELGSPAYTAPAPNAQVLSYGGSPVTVSWNGVAGADYYNVRIFNQREELVAQKPAVQDVSASFVLPADSYTCRIQAVAAETANAAMRTGAVSLLAFSVREPFPVEQKLPADAEKIAGLTALRKATVFTWQNSADKAKSYEFVLQKKQSDGSLREVERIAAGTRTSVSLQRLTEGSYVWQVRASTADGYPVDSATRTFTVERVPELARATLVSPSAKFVMTGDYLRKNRTIAFEWRPVSGATEYSFALYKKGSRGALTPVYTEKSVRGTSVRLKDLSVLDVGEFTWNVTAYCYAKDGYEEQRSRAASSDFTISFDAPQKVQPIKPGRMYGE